MKNFLSTLWYVFMAPFYSDFWEDEEAFSAYFGCGCSLIFMIIWFALVGLMLYALVLGIQYLQIYVNTGGI